MDLEAWARDQDREYRGSASGIIPPDDENAILRFHTMNNGLARRKILGVEGEWVEFRFGWSNRDIQASPGQLGARKNFATV